MAILTAGDLRKLLADTPDGAIVELEQSGSSLGVAEQAHVYVDDNGDHTIAIEF